MAEPRPRVFEYEVAYDGTAVATAEGTSVEVPGSWSPEHLVLAALLDCSLTSLRYHARSERRGAVSGERRGDRER